jgi:hypothetical protein
MKRTVLAYLFLSMALVTLLARPQNVNPERPQNMEVQHIPTPDEARARLSNTQFQQDAKELADLCSSLHSDMENLKQNVLGKDVIDRLKRVEKLSKRVREHLQR